MKERLCRTCAWWERQGDSTPGFSSEGMCHYYPRSYSKFEDNWCRHWSETTGWDVFEKKPGPIPDEQDTVADSKDFVIADLHEQIRIQKGLLRLASELFEKDLELYEIKHLGMGIDTTEAGDQRLRKRWLEEYRTKC